MKPVQNVRYWMIATLLALLIGILPATAASIEAQPPTPHSPTLARQTPIIVDHTSTDITAIPQKWIENAKRDLHIAYGHTSHGSQLITGMNGLIGFANDGGLGLALPEDIFAWNEGGTAGALDLDDYAMGGDVGYYPQWVENTHTYLGDPDPNTGRGKNHPDVNVIIWSWCGQASLRTQQTMSDTYLIPMTQLEAEYPGITFVYMTGHSDGSGEEGNLHQRNQQIRDYASANHKVLFDFYNIELYDPDDVYYGNKYVNDNCEYDPDGGAEPNRTRNWALDWQEGHTQDVDWYTCSCAHSQSLNCNRKAYAAWWLWARLAGWDGGTSSLEGRKTASHTEALPGATLTYTITIRVNGAPPTRSVTLRDTLPNELRYIPGSLTATSGAINDAAAPTLAWSGLLTPTPAVTVTYAVTVATTEWRSVINTAVITAPGQATITRTAAVQILRPSDYPDLTPSFKRVSNPAASFGERVTYTVGIQNATGPLSLTTRLSDTLSYGLLYIPGSLTATSGAVDDAAAPLLTWSGALSPTPAITLTYAARVTYTNASHIILPASLHNIAHITAPGYASLTRTATLKVNWNYIFLPLILRNTR